MSNTNNKINHLSINKNIESETANIKITENNNNKFKEPVQSDPRCTLPLSSSSHFCTTRSSSEPHTVESVCTAVVDTHATPTDLSHQPESDNTVNYNYNNNNIETEQCSDSPDECAPSKLLRSFILSVQCGERPFINTETEANSSDYEKNIDMNDQGTSNNQKFVSTTTTDNSSSSQYTATTRISAISRVVKKNKYSNDIITCIIMKEKPISKELFPLPSSSKIDPTNQKSRKSKKATLSTPNLPTNSSNRGPTTRSMTTSQASTSENNQPTSIRAITMVF